MVRYTLKSERNVWATTGGDSGTNVFSKRLKKKGYYQSMYTPGLWLHEWRPIQFLIVVDDFVVKYVGEEHAKNLVNSLVEHYEISQD